MEENRRKPSHQRQEFVSRASSSIRPAFALGVLALGLLTAELSADERRAPPPKFNDSQLNGIFFENLDEAFRGERPSLAKLRASNSLPAGSVTSGSVTSSTVTSSEADNAGGGAKTDDRWSGLISRASIEDEVKRVRLHFDSVVTIPSAFIGGGYQEARLDLTVLAMLFGVIHEYGGEVRWKDQAAAARNLLARTASNCKAGSTQVYNEAKLRRDELQDLVSGGGLTSPEVPEENDWSSIASRSPLMEYAEQLINALEDTTRDEASIKSEVDSIKRNTELLAVIGEVLVKEGMDDADDGDYATFSRAMTAEAKIVSEAIERIDVEAIRRGASLIRQRCDACHEQYR